MCVCVCVNVTKSCWQHGFFLLSLCLSLSLFLSLSVHIGYRFWQILLSTSSDKKSKKDKIDATKENLQKLRGINNWAVSLITYSGSFTKLDDELRNMDYRTKKKLMTKQKILPLSDNVNRLWIIPSPPPKKGGYGLASIEDYVDPADQEL